MIFENCVQNKVPALFWWRLVTSGTPQGSVWISVLFNVFVNDKGIKCNHSNFIEYIKLCSAVNTLERRGVIQGDMKSLRSKFMGTSWGSTRPTARFYTWLREIPANNSGWVMNGLRVALIRMTWGHWSLKGWTWAGHVHLQPVFWVASKEEWPSGW